MPSDLILEGLYKSKISGPCSASHRLGFGQTSYLRLKTSVELQIDQTMRTQTFRVRNEVVERGAVTKSSKRKESLR